MSRPRKPARRSRAPKYVGPTRSSGTDKSKAAKRETPVPKRPRRNSLPDAEPAPKNPGHKMMKRAVLHERLRLRALKKTQAAASPPPTSPEPAEPAESPEPAEVPGLSEPSAAPAEPPTISEASAHADDPFVPSAELQSLAASSAFPNQQPPLDKSKYVTPQVPRKPRREEAPIPPETEEDMEEVEINTDPGQKLRILRSSEDHRMFVRISKLLDVEAERPQESVLILKHLMHELKDFYHSNYRKEARKSKEKHRIVSRLTEIKERVLNDRIQQINDNTFDISPREDVEEIINMSDWKTYSPISFYEREFDY